MSEYDYFLDYLYTQWELARAYEASAVTDFTSAQISYDGGDDHAALGHVINGCRKVADCLVELTSVYTIPYPKYYLIKVLDVAGRRLDDLESAPAADVTMDTILSAMLSATDDEYKKFIGLVDAYRVGLWDKPFNVDYYAALAKGFAQWG